MKPITILFVITLIIFSCSQSKKQETNAYIPEEKFVDSLNIGQKGKTKVEIEKFHRNNNDETFVIVNFYKQDSVWNFKKQKNVGNVWRLTDKFYFDKDGITGIDAALEDFNNDGFNDFTYKSGIAARGGNEIRTLFIYDQKNRRFIHIKNSDNYPNLSFNSTLNCINSLILTGSTTTAFLRIRKDSLEEFARVDVSDKILVEEKDSLGEFKVIGEGIFEGTDEDSYKIFKNYKPLQY